MPCRRPIPVTPACRWAWPTSPRCCGPTTSGTTRAIPQWPDRDRFVLSNGHGSMLLYSLLHLDGLSARARAAQELPPVRLAHRRATRRSTRTSASRPPPGPLGQGLANAVGMALAEKILAATFNRPGHEVVDHRTWVFLGDGCLMEGVSHEACSLAGTLKLGKLIAASTTTTASRSTARCTAGSPTTRRSASRPTAGTWCATSTATTRRRSSARSQAAQGRARPPDAHLLQDHHRLGLARTSRAPRRRTARRSARPRWPRPASTSTGRTSRS